MEMVEDVEVKAPESVDVETAKRRKFRFLAEVFRQKRKERGILGQEIISSFVKELERPAEELGRFRLYHLVAGSTPRNEDDLELDLPDGTFERFILEKF